MEQKCLKIPKKKGEPARRVLLELKLLDNSMKIGSDETFLYLPLTRKPTLHELECLPEEGKILDFEFTPQKKKPTLEDILGFSPTYELIGDIAILEDSVPSSNPLSEIADLLLRTYPNIKTVLKPLTPVAGEFRVRDFKVLAGEPRTETLHKEYACLYKVDLAKVYFTPRLSTERARILSMIRKGDTVVDMFAGVGPYSILLAKSKKPAKVIAIDKNPEAIRYLRENISLNSVNNIEAIEGDAREEALKFAGTADHVIMNLPHTAYKFLDSAVLLTKSGGIIHYYGISPENDLFESSIKLIQETAGKTCRKIEILGKRIVRSYAPHQYNICIDVRVL